MFSCSLQKGEGQQNVVCCSLELRAHRWIPKASALISFLFIYSHKVDHRAEGTVNSKARAIKEDLPQLPHRQQAWRGRPDPDHLCLSVLFLQPQHCRCLLLISKTCCHFFISNKWPSMFKQKAVWHMIAPSAVGRCSRLRCLRQDLGLLA